MGAAISKIETGATTTMSDKRQPAGILIIDKPEGITSFDVVRAVRRALKLKKVGHTGTLDPLATGVLPLCLGEATKIAGLLLAEDKTYEGRAILGIETDTLDITGQVLARQDPGELTRFEVEQALERLRGRQLQVPPIFSAVRQQGVHAYKRARRGEQVQLEARPIEVHRLELRRFEPPELELYLECSKGTYVRSLVADLGRALGCGATLCALRRLRSGAFRIEQSIPLAELEQQARHEQPLPLVEISSALGHLPAVEVDAEQVRRLRQGQPVPTTAPEATLARVTCAGVLIALGEIKQECVHPRRIFADLEGPRSSR